MTAVSAQVLRRDGPDWCDLIPGHRVRRAVARGDSLTARLYDAWRGSWLVSEDRDRLRLSGNPAGPPTP